MAVEIVFHVHVIFYILKMSGNKPSTSKRKYEEDIAIRDFNNAWEEQFLFTNQNTSKPVCLICGACVAVPKKFNLERHFTQRHADFNLKCPVGSKLRTDLIIKRRIFSRPAIIIQEK